MNKLITAIALSGVALSSYAAPATPMATTSQETNMGSQMTQTPSNKATDAAAAKAPTQKAPMQNIQLTNNQKTVAISLPANATTGYQWFVQSYDHSLLTLQHYTYTPQNTKLVGSGGTATFTFAVNPHFYDAPQTSAISLVYQQPWNPGQNVSASTVTLTSSSSNASAATANTNAQTQQNNWLSLPSAMQINS